MRQNFAIILWFLALSFIILCLLHWLVEDQPTLVRWFSYFMPWVLIILFPAAILSLAWNCPGLFISFLLPIVYIIACYAPFFLPKQIASEPGPLIKVMSFNIWSKNNDMAEAGRIIESASPDILLLQEISPEQLDQLITQLKSSNRKVLPNVAFDPERLLAFMSRFPISAMPSLGTSRTKIQKVRVSLEGRDIIVFNVHFVRGCAQSRSKHTNKFIREQLVTNREPVLLGGDFNTTVFTSIYNSFNEILKNSHDEVGRGFGFTYPAQNALHLPAMLRIDHIFYSANFKAISATTLLSSGGSDHYPVTATFSLGIGAP